MASRPSQAEDSIQFKELKTAFVPPLYSVRVLLYPCDVRPQNLLASIVRVHALHIEVATLFKQLHQNRLYALALVQHGLRAHL